MDDFQWMDDVQLHGIEKRFSMIFESRNRYSEWLEETNSGLTTPNMYFYCRMLICHQGMYDRWCDGFTKHDIFTLFENHWGGKIDMNSDNPLEPLDND